MDPFGIGALDNMGFSKNNPISLSKVPENLAKPNVFIDTSAFKITEIKLSNI